MWSFVNTEEIYHEDVWRLDVMQQSICYWAWWDLMIHQVTILPTLTTSPERTEVTFCCAAPCIEPKVLSCFPQFSTLQVSSLAASLWMVCPGVWETDHSCCWVCSSVRWRSPHHWSGWAARLPNHPKLVRGERKLMELCQCVILEPLIWQLEAVVFQPCYRDYPRTEPASWRLKGR